VSAFKIGEITRTSSKRPFPAVAGCGKLGLRRQTKWRAGATFAARKKARIGAFFPDRRPAVVETVPNFFRHPRGGCLHEGWGERPSHPARRNKQGHCSAAANDQHNTRPVIKIADFFHELAAARVRAGSVLRGRMSGLRL